MCDYGQLKMRFKKMVFPVIGVGEPRFETNELARREKTFGCVSFCE